MKKTLLGVVISTKMQKTAVIRISREVPHPLYKKLIKMDSNLNVDTGKISPKVGDKVKVEETRPISKTKNFRIVEVVK